VVRPRLPLLRAIFALLAGLAPLHAERTMRRGGSIGEAVLADQLCFYETSSYGPRAVRAMATAVGIGQLVHGTDYPVDGAGADPVAEAFSAGWARIVRTSSPSRALGYTWVPA
jgi:6-methylsalicylate decarboxylase